MLLHFVVLTTREHEQPVSQFPRMPPGSRSNLSTALRHPSQDPFAEDIYSERWVVSLLPTSEWSWNGIAILQRHIKNIHLWDSGGKKLHENITITQMESVIE